MKHMKRSMFISTILMVVVLVVALSTATFAWYTASNTGSASTGNLVAANSSAANIAVGWTESDVTTAITFANAKNKEGQDTPVTVDPMVPIAAPSVTAESETAYGDLTFQTAPMDSTGKFGPFASATPWTVSNGAETNAKTSFYVINHNVNAPATVKMSCNIPTEGNGNANNLLVAVFVNGKLAGIFTKRANYTVGPIDQGAEASKLTTSDVGITNEISISLGAKVQSGQDHYAAISVKAWLDGADLVQALANQTAAFSFSFTA